MYISDTICTWICEENWNMSWYIAHFTQMLHISPQDSAEYLNILDSIRSLYLCASIEFADTGAYLGLCQSCIMELFAKIVNGKAGDYFRRKTPS